MHEIGALLGGISGQCRIKAQIKHDIHELESCLDRLLATKQENADFSEELRTLCTHLAFKYQAYLQLVDSKTVFDCTTLTAPIHLINWSEHRALILVLQERLSFMLSPVTQTRLLTEIATLYVQMSLSPKFTVSDGDGPSNDEQKKNELLRQLVNTECLESWIEVLVDFLNTFNIHESEPAHFFSQWNGQEQQIALHFFSKPQIIHLINTIWYFKLHPDKLFDESIHPEKLVSARKRLAILHSSIELVLQQLDNITQRSGFKSTVDYLIHGNQLPQGLTMEVSDEFRLLIQFAVKYIKEPYNVEKEDCLIQERLADLYRVFQFGFNAHRLIDAVMLLQQSVESKLEGSSSEQYLVTLFEDLSTNECLYLYGHFASDDTQYLMHLLLLITQHKSIDWLPPLKSPEIKAVVYVFNSVKGVMAALRLVLHEREITTAAYHYELIRYTAELSKPYQDLILKIIVVYRDDSPGDRKELEQLFHLVEKMH